MTALETLESIDKSKLRWIKNIKRSKGAELAYFSDYEEGIFNLHWSVSKASNAKSVTLGDYIFLFQNYQNKGILITHLVQVIDDIPFQDKTNVENFQTARKVKTIYRTKNVQKDKHFKLDFKNISQGQAFRLLLLNSSETEAAIRNNLINLFITEELSKFNITIKADGGYLFQIPRNKLYDRSQQIDSTSKTITFVGKNGCGKSAILESIFSASIKDNSHKYICFSSGQNELFSKIFGRIKFFNKDNYLDKEELRQEIYDTEIKAFYFNTRWIRVLVFLAAVFRPDGKSANLIRSKFNGQQDDLIPIKLGLDFKIDWDSTSKIKFEKENENRGIFSDYLHSSLFTTIDAFVRHCIDSDPEYNQPIKQTKIEITPETARKIYQDKSVDTALNCFNYGEQFFDLSKTKLQINNLELRDLSDGEFQLLSVYALIDLFDSPSTVFLFDEIDSHLYFDNISKVWQKLNELQSFTFVTTHIVDSIILNKIENIRLVDFGKINNEAKLYELLERLNSLSEGEYKKKKIATQVEYIALVEDKTDWIIFTELAKKKLGANFNKEKIDKVHIVKCEGGYEKDGDDFGETKKFWVKEFAKSSKEIRTRNIFLICDRDVLPIGNMHPLTSPQALGDPKALITITGDPKANLPIFKGKRTPHLLSWRRREIENYLFTYSVLSNFHLLQAVKSHYGVNGTPQEHATMDGNEIILNGDFKPTLEPILYKQNSNGKIDLCRWDYDKLHRVLDIIPAEEVSEDFIYMHNYLISHIY